MPYAHAILHTQFQFILFFQFYNNLGGRALAIEPCDRFAVYYNLYVIIIISILSIHLRTVT